VNDLPPRFFGVAKPNGAGCIGHTVKPFGFATTKKIKVNHLLLGEARH
jgi:hypothetical protein